MKKRINNTYLLFVAFMIILSCCSVYADDSAQKVQYDDKWTVIHKANGATRFEYNFDNKLHFYELQVTGLEFDGEIEQFSIPEISKRNGRVTKQWTSYLHEIWTDDHDKNIIIQINKPRSLSPNSPVVKLLYTVDSNFQDRLSVGDYPNLLFYNFTDESSRFKTLIKPSISVMPSHCNDSITFSPSQKGEHEVVLDLNKQQFPFYLQTYLTLKPGSSGQLISSHKTVLSHEVGNIKLAVHQEILQISKSLKHQIKVLEHNKADGWQQQIIKDWPLSGKCEYAANNFGDSMAIEGDWLVVGDSNDCEEKMFSGALYVFHKNNKKWQFHSKIKTKEIYREGSFGGQLTIQDGVIYASSNNNYLQQIHLFKLTGNSWQEQPGIMINGRSQASGSMSEFKVSDQLLVIGMEGFLDPKYFTHQSGGEALVYRNTGSKWQFETSLKPSIAKGDDGFGSYVAVADNVIAVASLYLPPSTKVQTKGAVHLFEFDSGKWKTTQVIRPEIESLEVNTKREGFVTGLEMSKTDLYIQDAYLVYQTKEMNDLPDVCAFASGSGAIHHYQKKDSHWQLLKSIKPGRNSWYFNQAVKVAKDRLYFLSTEHPTSDQSEILLNQYQDGKIVESLPLMNFF